MNRPLTSRTVRGTPGRVPQAPRPAASRVVTPAPGGSFIATAMLWILIIYLAVPIQYFSGDMVLAGDASMALPHPMARAIKLGLLVLSVVLLLWKNRLAALELRSVNRGFIFFMVLVPLSAIWSIEPGTTLNRTVSLLSIVSVCLVFTLLGWHRTRFQDVVRPLVTALLVASVVFGIMYPEYAIEVGEGTLKNSWRGLTAQKNQFGMLSSFGVVFWLHAWFSGERKWWAAVPGVGLCFTCVLLSRSSTSLMATTLSTLFMVLVMISPASMRRYMPFIVSAFAILVVVYALAVLNIIPGTNLLLDPIAELTGKDMTFSNRAVIWNIIKEHIDQSPLLGSGYGAYWTGPVPTSPSYVFLTRMEGFYPTQSHNGYLEIVNDLGFVGLICLLTYLVYWVRQSLQLMRIDRTQGMLFLALFFQQAITNLSESTWLAINSAFAIAVASLATFCMARSLLEQRLQDYFAHAARRAR